MRDEYDNLLQQMRDNPTEPAVRLMLADCVTEMTGYPADAIMETADPTGHTMAVALVLHQSHRGSRLRQVIRDSVARGPWYRRPIIVAWGYSAPTVTGESAREYARSIFGRVEHPRRKRRHEIGRASCRERV